jgi:hypothetical protein
MDGCEVHPLAQTIFRTPSPGTAHQVARCWGAVASRRNAVCFEQKAEEFPFGTDLNVTILGPTLLLRPFCLKC